MSEVGGSETNRDIGFGSVVRASEAACACEAMLLPTLGSGNRISPARLVPCAARALGKFY